MLFMHKDALEDERRMQEIAIIQDERGFEMSAENLSSIPIPPFEIQIISQVKL